MITSQTPRAADAVTIAHAVRAGRSSPAAEVEAAIDRARQVDGTINAIVEPTFERAREQAAATPTTGPMAGVPILLKDLFCPVTGDPAYQGNRRLKERDHRYDHTGAVGRRLRDAGTVSIGRSHSPELGCGQSPGASETVLYGPCRNPWNPDRTPLGSSGGAAAAVAAGVVPVAHGSDGGGSIRQPASATGLIGLKPSRGRISGAPAGEMWAGGATDGVITRTVADTALALDVLAGPEPGDPYLAPPPARPFSAEVGAEPGSLWVGLCPTVPFADTDPVCSAVVATTGDLLTDLGHRVGAGHPPAMASNDYMYDYIRVIRVSLVAELELFTAALGRSWTEDDVEEGTWINYQRGRKVSGGDFVASRERLHAFTRSMVAWWQDGPDLLVTPTVGITVPEVGYLVDGDERTLTARLASVTPFLPQFNVTGQPAISLPVAVSPLGLPVGVQLVAAPGREDVLLRVASQLEAVVGWAERRPPIFAETGSGPGPAGGASGDG